MAACARYGNLPPSEFDRMSPADSSRFERDVRQLHNEDMRLLVEVGALIARGQVPRLGL